MLAVRKRLGKSYGGRHLLRIAGNDDRCQNCRKNGDYNDKHSYAEHLVLADILEEGLDLSSARSSCGL